MKRETLCVFLLCLLCGLLAACAKKPCICTTDLRVNYCLTFNGQKEIPDSLLLVRIQGGLSDTLHIRDAYGNCFPEKPGDSKIRVFKGDGLVVESGLVRVRTVDCCHGEAKTVDLKLP